MKLLVDINVVLDVLLLRDPWAREATLLLAAIERGSALGYVASHTVPTVHYVVERTKGRAPAVSAVSDLLRIMDVVPLDRADAQQALALGMRDFEDALQAVSTLKVGADAIVTRDVADYAECSVPALRPGIALARLG